MTKIASRGPALRLIGLVMLCNGQSSAFKAKADGFYSRDRKPGSFRPGGDQEGSFPRLATDG